MSSSFRATYRLQLRPEFGFREALEVVPYLRQLGVSHLYLSPIMEARPGSTHGYDVVDPTRISEQLGGEAAFRELAQAGLGIVLDVVPNHMAASDENRSWADPAARAKVFDWDPEAGWYRRFFTIDDLAGVRVEDPEVFELTQRKAIELVDEGLVDGLRIDHPDGLADPRGYLEQIAREGVEHVWVEKILERGAQLRDWPVEGTTGYEFANDVTALLVDPRGEEPLTAWYERLTGDRRTFDEVAADAKREIAESELRREVDKLLSLAGGAADRGQLVAALAGLEVYRTYVEPWSGRVEDEDRAALAHVAALRGILLLEEGGHDELVTRFQQTSPAVLAKGVEDTAFYRYLRLSALNEVGGDPARFSLSVEGFHRANIERARGFPRHLLATQTHDTKRSGDVRARIAAVATLADEWVALRPGWRVLEEGHEDELLWQTLVGAWPIEPQRIEGYLEKALREAKVSSSWVEPNEPHERRVKDAARRAIEAPPPGFEEFVSRAMALGSRLALAMTLLKLTVPGVPDIYQGDERTSLSLVDPDNRRAVDWGAPPDAKTRVVREALALAARRELGTYRPLDLGPDVCAFVRGEDVAVVAPLRGQDPPSPELPGSWRDVLEGLPVRLLERV